MYLANIDTNVSTWDKTLTILGTRVILDILFGWFDLAKACT